MSASFGGSAYTSSGDQDPYLAERDVAIDLFRAYGFTLLDDITDAALVTGVAGAFAPDDLGPECAIPDVSLQTQRYFGNTVRPRLIRDMEAGNQKALQLVHQFGRFLGVAYQGGVVGVQGSRDLFITDTHIVIDGIEQPYTLEAKQIADFGMSFAGIVAHLQNVRAERYKVLGLQEMLGQAALLQGVALQRGIARDRLQVYSGGIQANIDKIEPHGLDVIIASRVHSAGKDLVFGIERAAMLLRSGGVLVARGPRYYEASGYDRVFGIIRDDPAMRILENRTYERESPWRASEPSRVIIAQAK